MVTLVFLFEKPQKDTQKTSIVIFFWNWVAFSLKNSQHNHHFQWRLKFSKINFPNSKFPILLHVTFVSRHFFCLDCKQVPKVSNVSKVSNFQMMFLGWFFFKHVDTKTAWWPLCSFSPCHFFGVRIVFSPSDYFCLSDCRSLPAGGPAHWWQRSDPAEWMDGFDDTPTDWTTMDGARRRSQTRSRSKGIHPRHMGRVAELLSL